MRETFGGIVGGIASLLATSCCIAPTLFVVFGVSVGGLSSLRVLEPYKPIFLLVGYLAVGYSLYRFYLKDWFMEKVLKKHTVECACEDPNWAKRFSKGVTWVALVLLVFATFYPYVLEKLYGG